MSNSMFKTSWMLWLGIVSLFAFTSCNDDDPEPENEPEVITRMEIRFTNQANASNVVIAEFNDPDGPGGQAPTFQHPTFQAGATYVGEIRLWNDLENEEKTQEIQEEDDEHQFFFVYTNNVFSSREYLDQDPNGLPVGLRTRFTASATAGSGTLRVALRHMPTKNTEGDITNAGGDTDIDVTFNVTVQ